jgi:hypothetical protein
VVTVTGETKGLEDVLRRLGSAEDYIAERAGKALRSEGEALLARASETVPRQTGRLAASGYVTAPVETSSGVTVEVGYSAPYAPEVHERMERRHASGQSKWLEKAAQAEAAELAPAVAEQVKR